MTTQLYSFQSDAHYRVLSRDGVGAMIFRQPAFVAAAHEHPEAQVSMLFGAESASLLTHSEGGTATRTALAAGSFAYVPPGQPHRLSWTRSAALLNLYLSQQTLRELAEQSGSALPTLWVAERPDHGVFEIGRLLLQEFQATGGLMPAMVEHASLLAAHRIARVAERVAGGGSPGLLSVKRLQPAIERIRANPELDFTLIELAKACNSSVFHFARSFSARMGAAPFSFQRTLRLQKARDLLAKTELPIASVSATVGIANATHFARLFRREAGFSPREYRRLANAEPLT